LISNNFKQQDLYGVSASQVIFGFMDIDIFLAKAADGAQHGASTDAIVGALEAAQRDKKNLETKFRNRGSASVEMLSAFGGLDNEMADVISLAKAGTLSGEDLKAEIDFRLEVAKHQLINTYFVQDLSGLPANQVIREFIAIDVDLTHAIDDAASGADNEEVVDELEKAKEAKQKLEKEFAAAATCSQPKARGLAASAAQACPSPSVTLGCPPTATLDGQLAVSGTVNPAAPGESVAVAYTPPGGSPFTEPATTNTAGAFNSSATISASGTWKTQAFEGSIASAPCYTTVG
jgi:hypothetical protein